MNRKYVLTYDKGSPNLSNETMDIVILESDDEAVKRAKLNRLRDRFRGWISDVDMRESDPEQSSGRRTITLRMEHV